MRTRCGSILVLLSGLLAAGCSSAPSPETAPVPDPVRAAAPPAPILAPSAVAGNWRLRTEIQRQGSQQHGAHSPAQTPLVLSSTPSAAPQMGAPDAAFNATVQVPGYTHAPRGRRGQAAAWWPIPGDSVVVQFAAQHDDLMQLRGKLEGSTLSGEIWYLSMASGAIFQMGTFGATRQTSRGR